LKKKFKIRDYLPSMRLNKNLKEDIEKKVRESSAAAVANVEKEFKYDLEELRNTVESLNPQVLASQDDLFYKSMYSNWGGKGAKEFDPEKSVTEAVKYGRARGFFTAYNMPLERKQSDEERRYAQTISYNRVHEDPLIGAIPDVYQRFALGRGVKFRCDEPKIQALLEEFWRDNSMDMYLKRLAWLLVTESEYFPLYFISKKTGKVKIREIQPLEVVTIETNPNDKSVPLSYCREFFDDEMMDNKIPDKDRKRRYYADINYFIQKIDELDGHTSEFDGKEGWQKDDKLVQFVKLMKNREVRSRVFLERVMKWGEWYKQWLTDRAIINHEVGRVCWILEISSRKSEVWERYKPAPAGGTTKISTPDRKWIPTNAKINANDSKEDGLFLQYQICAGASLPLHVLTQRATESNYSSLKKSENPMTMAILDFQDLLSESFLKPMFRLIIRSARNASSPKDKIPSTVNIRRYVTEYLREVFRNMLEAYQDEEIDSRKMLKTIKVVTENFIEDFKKDETSRGIAGIYDVILNEMETLKEMYIKDSINLLESKEAKIDSNLIKKAYEIIESGINLKVEPENVPIEIIFPDMYMDDPLNTAKILKLYKEIGIASNATLMAKAGLNADQEKFLISKEQKELQKQGLLPDVTKGKEDGKPKDTKSDPDDGTGTGDQEPTGHGRSN